MTTRIGLALAGLGCWAAVLWWRPPDPVRLTDLGVQLARPVTLPFLWRALRDAERSGSPAEAYAAARMLLELLPTWTDGHLVFAYRFVLAGDELVGGDAAARAARRLQTALLILDQARSPDPARQIDLLVGTAFLVELAGRHHPELGRHLGGGAGLQPEVLAHRYLEQAERLGTGPSVRELRVFAVPGLMAGLLRAGDRERALEVLDAALARLPEVRDRQLAADWGETLRKVRAFLTGDRNISPADLLADPRLQPLTPFLR